MFSVADTPIFDIKVNIDVLSNYGHAFKIPRGAMN